MTSWLTSGLPRQFFVMKENSRCSILFHLLRAEVHNLRGTLAPEEDAVAVFEHHLVDAWRIGRVHISSIYRIPVDYRYAIVQRHHPDMLLGDRIARQNHGATRWVATDHQATPGNYEAVTGQWSIVDLQRTKRLPRGGNWFDRLRTRER